MIEDEKVDAPLKILPNKVRRRNEYAKDLEDVKYRQRVVRPDKEYSRKGKKQWRFTVEDENNG